MARGNDKAKCWQFSLWGFLIACTLCGVITGIAGPTAVQAIQEWQTPAVQPIVVPAGCVQVGSHARYDDERYFRIIACCEVVDGDEGVKAIFPARAFDEVVKIKRKRKRRRPWLSPERLQELMEASEPDCRK